jgi:hypothetical protein
MEYVLSTVYILSYYELVTRQLPLNPTSLLTCSLALEMSEVVEEKLRKDEHDILRLRQVHKKDNALLAKLGYKSEFRRAFSVRIFGDQSIQE